MKFAFFAEESSSRYNAHEHFIYPAFQWLNLKPFMAIGIFFTYIVLYNSGLTSKKKRVKFNAKQESRFPQPALQFPAFFMWRLVKIVRMV
jgi:hypothetical protein